MEKKMENSLNAFELAGQIGQLSLPAFAEVAKPVFEEFELCFASRLPLSPRFSDAPEMRCVQHLSLYWQRGYLKGVLMNMFAHCLPDDTYAPQTSRTAEMFFGSINGRGDALAYPFFHQKDFCFVPELLALLGSGGSLSDKVHIFNEVLECQQIERSLVKFSSATPELRKEYENGKEGITLRGNTLQYLANTAFIIATHPVNSETFEELNTDGFWDRLHTLQADIHDDLTQEIFTGAMAPGNEFLSQEVAGLMSQLKEENVKMWQSRPNEMKQPPYNTVMLPILTKASEYGKTMAQKMRVNLNQVIRLRIRGDITREVSAYKLLHPEISDEELIKWTEGRMQHFFEFALSPNIGSDSVFESGRARAACIQSTIRNFKGKGKVKAQEILASMTKENYSKSTVNRALEYISQRPMNKTRDYGYYEIE